MCGLMKSGCPNSIKTQQNQLLSGDAPNMAKMLVIASNINVSRVHAVRLIDKIDVCSLCAVWKSLLFAVDRKVFSFFLMNIEKYVALMNLNDSTVHDAMRLQNVFNITTIQCKVK